MPSWIDAIARAGVTFKYTETGPVGLVEGKTVYAACARGGLYRGTQNDSQTPYLKAVLGFLGMKDVHFVYAEGLNMGPDAAAQGLITLQQSLQSNRIGLYKALGGGWQTESQEAAAAASPAPQTTP